MRKKTFMTLMIMIILSATSVWVFNVLAKSTTGGNHTDSTEVNASVTEGKDNSTKVDASAAEKDQEETENKLDPDGKYLALTFDDGPHPQLTPSVLETLKQFEVPATFYMLGANVSQHPDLTKKVAEAGHELGNHSVSHSNLTKMPITDVKQEIEKTNAAIVEATGEKPHTMRPPYGAQNKDVLKILEDEDQPAVLWSVDSYDWKSDAEKVKQEVLQQVHDGAIILMHDIHESTEKALPDILTALKEKGYKFVTVSELLSLQTGDDVGPYYMQ